MTIASQAQHDMFTRAVADPDYAKLRGISADFARARLQAHADAGSPELPDRAKAAKPAVKQTVKQDAGTGLLGAG